MPTPTYDLLASNVLSSSASSVTFSSIPSTYRDLVLVTSILGTSDTYFRFQFNGDTGSNYETINMAGNGSTASSSTTSSTGGYLNFRNSSGTTERILSITSVMDYSATNKHKTSLIRANTSSLFTEAIANRWANTAAITSMLIYPQAGNFASGSTFYLYGIVS